MSKEEENKIIKECQEIDKEVKNKGNRKELFQKIKKLFEENQKDIQVIWRFARAHYMV
jgi:hypothetical protein